MQNRMTKIMAGVMMRYAVRGLILLGMVVYSLINLPKPAWMICGMIPALYMVFLWGNFQEDRYLDEDFRELLYEEYFSVAGEKGKFRILNRQCRSYDEMINLIARQPGDAFTLERDAISIRDGEIVIARAEFESPCKMRCFLSDYYCHFVYPYLRMRGIII